MKKLLFAVLMILLSAQAASAQILSPSDPNWKKEMDKVDEGVYKLKNGRTYQLLNNTVVETPDLRDILPVQNIFDFDNSLVFHRDLKKHDNLAVTPFGQIPPARVREVKIIGCLIARLSGDQNNHHPVYCQDID